MVRNVRHHSADPVVRAVRTVGVALGIAFVAYAGVQAVDWDAALDALPGCGPGWDRRWAAVSEGDFAHEVERCLGPPDEAAAFDFDSTAVAAEVERWATRRVFGPGPEYGYLLGLVPDGSPVERRVWERREAVDWGWTDSTWVTYTVELVGVELAVVRKGAAPQTGQAPLY